jgi:hypothetical protein
MQTSGSYTLTTTGTELTEGTHYWEVELLTENMSCIFIGISRPNLNPAGYNYNNTDGWFIQAARYNQSDRVGVLLDLNGGSLRFFKNGVQHGPSYAAGSVTGPVVAALQMGYRGQSVRLLPNAEAPANA